MLVVGVQLLDRQHRWGDTGRSPRSPHRKATFSRSPCRAIRARSADLITPASSSFGLALADFEDGVAGRVQTGVDAEDARCGSCEKRSVRRPAHIAPKGQSRTAQGIALLNRNKLSSLAP